MADEHDEFQGFMSKVSLLEGILKGTEAGDDDIITDTTHDGGEKTSVQLNNTSSSTKEKKKKKYPPLDNTGVNRSVINHAAFKEDRSPADDPPVTSGMNQAAFMAVMEQDAKDRARRRAAKEDAANKLKEKGNQEFKAGNYSKAVQYYTEALQEVKHLTALYTNRAQAYIKLQEYDKALVDCDWALRVDDKCIKAYIHQGRAHLGLRQYTEAKNSYNTALQVSPQAENAIKGYIAEVEHIQRTEHEEQKARELLEEGGTAVQGLVELLQKLNKPDQPAMYYSGCLRLITSSLTDTTNRTLFRTNGGLSITSCHVYIARCFSASLRSMSAEEHDLCVAVMEALTAACTDNDENQKRLADSKDFTGQLLRFLETKSKSSSILRQSVITFLYVLSQSDYGGSNILDSVDFNRLLSAVVPELIKASSVAMETAGLLKNLSIHKRYKASLCESVDTILPAIEGLLTDKKTDPHVLTASITMVTNLVGDPEVRQKVISKETFWKSLLTSLEHHKAQYISNGDSTVLFDILGLFINLTVKPSQHLTCFSSRLCQSCCSLVDSQERALVDRAVTVLGRVVKGSPPAAAVLTKEGVPQKLINLIKQQVCVKSCVHCLTLCATHHDPARSIVADSGMVWLAALLQNEDYNVVGNAALLLSQCVMEPGAAAKLETTDIMKHLLEKARDSSNVTVQKNCAIVIAKLAQTSTGHLEKLRELDGLGILHTVLKQS